MTHKVHPKIFRIKETKDWDSRWIEKKRYASFLKEDFYIRKLLAKSLKDASVDHVEIERFRDKITIIIYSARPGMIIGRRGSGIEELKKALLKVMDGKRKDMRLEIMEIKNPWESASLTAQWIAQQLERRMPHRRLIKQTAGKVMANKGIEGVRIDVAGRLGGADIARRESVKQGRLPLQTLRAIIDYAIKEAKTTYGIIGVKVWIYKGEKFEE